MTQQPKLREGIVMTPKFRVSFPNVFAAKKNDMNGEMEYSIVMLFDKTADLNGMKALCKAAIEKKWGNQKPSKLRSPFRDGNVDKAGRAEYVDITFVNAKSKQRPGLVDESREPIIDPSQFYAGCYARATLTAYAYDVKGNAGVAFGLQNIQKVNDGEPLGSRSKAEDDFEPVGTTGSLAGNDDKELFG